MITLMLFVFNSTLSVDVMLPEIEITAPRLSEHPGDSVGMIPEIIIYGEKSTPQSVSKMVRTYSHYKSNYQRLCNTIWN